jgi:predicted TIM-barrel fold metal-dependent hydrolase
MKCPKPKTEAHASRWSRRHFLSTATMSCVALSVAGCKTVESEEDSDAIIDIHQHLGYNGRSDEALQAHQRAMGVSKTILLPAGRPANTASTHGGISNGLQTKCLGNEACYEFAKAHPREYLFAANEVPDVEGAVREIEKYLKLGAVGIGEQKFGIECDSPEMQRIYQVATEYRVPILMHWQYGMYNYGFERLPAMLRKYPKTIFIGHAQTWWANIDKNYVDWPVLYPKGAVTAGGLTDRYLSGYPNMYGDLSAASGLNALTRDEDRAREFLLRHQDKLMFGSDCNDLDGAGPKCSGSQTIAAVRRLVTDKRIQRKLFCKNAERVFRINVR